MPVIVLMDKETSGEHSQIRTWLEHSRFSTFEASNVFEAFEEISDFTIESRPDVVLVDVDSCEDDLPIVRNIAAMSDLSVMALSGKSASDSAGPGKYFHSSFGQMASQLDKLIPQ
jgi:DNA-binding response OmpR family regulator